MAFTTHQWLIQSLYLLTLLTFEGRCVKELVVYLLKGVKWEWSINHPSVYVPESAARSPTYNGLARFHPHHRFSSPFAVQSGHYAGEPSGLEMSAPYSYIRYHFGVNSQEDTNGSYRFNSYPSY